MGVSQEFGAKQYCRNKDEVLTRRFRGEAFRRFWSVLALLALVLCVKPACSALAAKCLRPSRPRTSLAQATVAAEACRLFERLRNLVVVCAGQCLAASFAALCLARVFSPCEGPRDGVCFCDAARGR